MPVLFILQKLLRIVCPDEQDKERAEKVVEEVVDIWLERICVELVEDHSDPNSLALELFLNFFSKEDQKQLVPASKEVAVTSASDDSLGKRSNNSSNTSESGSGSSRRKKKKSGRGRGQDRGRGRGRGRGNDDVRRNDGGYGDVSYDGSWYGSEGNWGIESGYNRGWERRGYYDQRYNPY